MNTGKGKAPGRKGRRGAKPKQPELEAPIVPEEQHLEFEMAAARDEGMDPQRWDKGLEHKRRLPRLQQWLTDPGPCVLEKLDPKAAGVLLGSSGKPIPVANVRNPQPKGSFGFVGVSALVEHLGDCRSDAELVLRFDPKKLGTVSRESLRLFYFDQREKRFTLVKRSAVALDGDYVYSRISAPGRYALIGINAHPLVLSTLHLFCDLSSVIRSSVDLGPLIRDRICAVILCPADGLAARLGRDTQLLERLAQQGERMGFNAPPGHQWTEGPAFYSNLCDRCFGIPGVPPECEILVPPITPTLCTEPEWETVGPRDLAGHLHRVIVDPDNPDRLFAAGFNCGIWTLDSVSRYPAVTWRPLTDQLDTLRFRCLKAAPSDGDVLYAGALNGRLYRSTDHGEHWARAGEIDLGAIYELMVHRSNPDIVYVATSNGLRRSMNGGADWSPMLYTGQVVDAVMDPLDSSILYIGVRWVGVLKSYLSGAAEGWEIVLPWSRVSNPLEDGVDAVQLYIERGGIYYFFRGNDYTRYNDNQGVEPGHPRSIDSHWTGWPAHFAAGIDAALLHADGTRYYAFKGSEYIRHQVSGLDAGYPRPIAGNWGGWPDSFTSGIDAALLIFDNSGYWFFKGDQFLRYTPTVGMDAGYPRAITDEWSGWPADWDAVDAAVLRDDNGGYYFFRGDQCALFGTDQAIRPGYPRAIKLDFPGTRSTEIRVALGERHADGSLQSDADRTVVAKFSNEVFVNRQGGSADHWVSKGRRGRIGYRSWCHCLAVDPFDPDVILAGQQQLFRSENGGDSWDTVATYYRPHEDQHSVAFDPVNSDTVYLANDGGVFRSTDDGRTWWTDAGTAAEIRVGRDLNRDLVTAEFYRVGVKGNRALGNLYHSGVIGSTSLTGGSWRGAEGHSWEFNEVFADPVRARRYLIFGGNLVLKLWPPAADERSLMRFSYFEPYDSGIVGCIAVDGRAGSNTILVGAEPDPDDESSGYRLMRTLEGDATPTLDEATETWSGVPAWTVAIDNGDDPFASVAFAPSDPGRAYAMSRAGQCFAKSDVNDAGAWAEPGAWTSTAGGAVRQLAVNGTDEEVVYAVNRSRFARSETGGANWDEVGTASLPLTDINSVAAEPGDANRVFIGAEDGVYASDDRGDSWSPFDAGLPNAVVTQIYREGRYLYAVTHGRGLWRARIC